MCHIAYTPFSCVPYCLSYIPHRAATCTSTRGRPTRRSVVQQIYIRIGRAQNNLFGHAGTNLGRDLILRSNLYIHSWAAYTPEGSKRRMRAAKGQLAYLEWRADHPTQVPLPSQEVVRIE